MTSVNMSNGLAILNIYREIIIQPDVLNLFAIKTRKIRLLLINNKYLNYVNNCICFCSYAYEICVTV